MISTLMQNKSILIQGPVGQLEVLADSIGDAHGTWGIICHPHPLHGGTMHNKVVTTLAKTFQALGVSTVRFNFRGVGKSEGQFDQGHGELEDLLAVMDWVQREHSKQSAWLAGFSFGSYIAAKAATQIPVAHLVTIAPPVQHFPMQTLPPILCPWIVVQGEKDEIVPAEAVLAWALKRDPQPVILRFPEAGHFFHGQLGELRSELQSLLK